MGRVVVCLFAPISCMSNCNLVIIVYIPTHPIQMYSKVKSGKVSFKLADTAEKAKKLVTVGGLSEASAEGNVHV